MQMSSKMRFTPSMTAADALDVIYKKVRKLDANLHYRLWLPPPKNIFAEPDSVLQQFALREGDVIVVKQQGAAVPPYYQMAAADLWLAVIEEYRFLFANGAARFTAAVHRVPVAHGVQSANASVGGFRRRDVITAETARVRDRLGALVAGRRRRLVVVVVVVVVVAAHCRPICDASAKRSRSTSLRRSKRRRHELMSQFRALASRQLSPRGMTV
jgi:hypothetical protein